MRYIIVRESEDGAPVVTALGGIILWDDLSTVGAAAKRLKDEEGGTYYVQKLVTVARFHREMYT